MISGLRRRGSARPVPSAPSSRGLARRARRRPLAGPLCLLLAILSSARAIVAAGCDPVLIGAAHSGGPLAPSTLYRIDRLTGAAAAIGPIGFAAVGALDFDPATGRLYGTANRPADAVPVLIVVDPRTGAGREIGPLNTARRGPFDVSFRASDATLFALAFSFVNPCSSLYTIDAGTGAALEIGDTGTCASGDALGFTPAEVLHQSNNASGGTLFTVDTLSGLSISTRALHYQGFPPLADPRTNAMAFDAATGDAFVSVNDGSQGAGPNYLASLDPATGRISHIGRTADGLDALAYGVLRLGPDITALPDGSGFTWSETLDHLFATGTIGGPGELGGYLHDVTGSGTGTWLAAPQTPASGASRWYLLRPDCPGGSWSSGGPGECLPAGACPPGGRDAALP